jgi:flagellar hook protein FlgE
MIRSMYAAISGLRNHQTMMDVVGNNIANVNTNGFKGSSAVFTDVLSQTLNGGGAPSAAIGGTNPAQVGLGSRLGAINTDFSQGSMQRSGRITDFAIQGDGFFVIDQGGSQVYSRAGSFSLDAAGSVVNNEGGYMMGWLPDATGAVNTNTPIQKLSIPTGALIPPKTTDAVTMTGNLPANATSGTAIATSINVYDNAGTAIQLNLTFTKTVNAGEWTVTATQGNPPAAAAITGGTITFNGSGALTGTPAISLASGVLPNMGAVAINLGSASDPVTQFGAGASILARSQTGFAAGSLEAFSMGRDGTLVGSYSNGQTRPIGLVAMAAFANPQGLEKIGSSEFRVSANSGAAEIGQAGTGGRGLLLQGALEMSNVDLAQEFTQLIVAQRGFQANSRVITTSDEMLQEVVNLKR